MNNFLTGQQNMLIYCFLFWSE